MLSWFVWTNKTNRLQYTHYGVSGNVAISNKYKKIIGSGTRSEFLSTYEIRIIQSLTMKHLKTSRRWWADRLYKSIIFFFYSWKNITRTEPALYPYGHKEINKNYFLSSKLSLSRQGVFPYAHSKRARYIIDRIGMTLSGPSQCRRSYLRRIYTYI